MNGREVKDTEQMRRFAAIGLTHKQQAGELTPEEAMILGRLMEDPNVRGFVFNAIKQEAAPEAKKIAEAYTNAKGTAAAAGSTSSEAQEVANTVNTYKAMKAGTVTAHSSTTAEELEAKKIAEAYNSHKVQAGGSK